MIIISTTIQYQAQVGPPSSLVAGIAGLITASIAAVHEYATDTEGVDRSSLPSRAFRLFIVPSSGFSGRDLHASGDDHVFCCPAFLGSYVQLDLHKQRNVVKITHS